MKRIKVVDDISNIPYPRQQKDLMLKLRSTKGIFNALDINVPIGTQIIKVPNKHTIINFPTNAVVTILSGTIGRFVYANLSTNVVHYVELPKLKSPTLMSAGTYISMYDNLVISIDFKKGQLSSIPQPVSMSHHITDDKGYFILSTVARTIRLYDNKYIVMSFYSVPYCPLFIKTQQATGSEERASTLDVSIDTYNSKSIFKDFYNHPDKYVTLYVPILITTPFSGVDDLLFTKTKLTTFNINDINNF